jgi:GTPase SAR1 family protein
VFLGSSGVGKTSIIRWFLDLPPIEDYLPTIGIRFHNIDTEINKVQYYLQFCDVSGSELYSDLLPSLLKNSSVIILVFDYKDQESQLSVQQLYDRVCDYSSPNQILLVGNKAEHKKKDVPKSIKSWVKNKNLVILPISVLEDSGKSLLLQNIVRIISELPRS